MTSWELWMLRTKTKSPTIRTSKSSCQLYFKRLKMRNGCESRTNKTCYTNSNWCINILTSALPTFLRWRTRNTWTDKKWHNKRKKWGSRCKRRKSIRVRLKSTLIIWLAERYPKTRPLSLKFKLKVATSASKVRLFWEFLRNGANNCTTNLAIIISVIVHKV